MKKIICLLVLVFCLSLQMMAQNKKPVSKPATPTMPDIEKMLKDLPADQQATVRDMITKQMSGANKTEDAKANTPLDEWNKAQRETAAAIGTKMSKVIGPEGGELKSANGKVKLNFPADAVSEKTEIGIEEIENTAALACGNAFKLTPESATFKKPVLLTLKYTPFDIDCAAPEALNIMTKSENMWFAYKNVEIDTITHTVSLPIRHFSDWGVGAFFKLVMQPAGKELGRGQQETFYITTVESINEEKAAEEKQKQKEALEAQLEEQKITDAAKKQEQIDDLEERQKQIKESQQKAIAEEMKKLWEKDHPGEQINDKLKETKVDITFGGVEFLKAPPEMIFGVGRVEFGDDDPNDPNLKEILLLRSVNTYKGFKVIGWKMNGSNAPIKNEMGALKSSLYYDATYTAPSVVPLYTSRDVAISFEMINLTSKAKFIFISHVYLTNNGWFKATIDGRHWYAPQLMDRKNIAAIQGKTAGEIKSASATYIEEPAESKGLILQIVNGFPTSLALRIENPHLGANIIDCNTEGTTLFMGDWAGVLTSYRRKMNGSTCETIEEVCNKITVNLTSLNLKNGGLVAGNFSGILFGGEKGCVNSLEHKVAGSFSLSVSMSSAAKDFLDKNHIKVPTDNN